MWFIIFSFALVCSIICGFILQTAMRSINDYKNYLEFRQGRMKASEYFMRSSSYRPALIPFIFACVMMVFFVKFFILYYGAINV